MLSLPHLIVLFVIALVIFGPQKLPELARMLGKATAEFRKMTNDFRYALEDEVRDLERQIAYPSKRKSRRQPGRFSLPQPLRKAPCQESYPRMRQSTPTFRSRRMLRSRRRPRNPLKQPPSRSNLKP